MDWITLVLAVYAGVLTLEYRWMCRNRDQWMAECREWMRVATHYEQGGEP